MLIRRLVLKLTENRTFMDWVGRLAMRSGLVHRFIAGEDIDEALAVVRSLHDTGVMTTLNLLGEEVQDQKKADEAARSYVELLRALDQFKVRSQVSVKLSQLGLGVSRKTCSANLAAVLEASRKLGNFVRIDMESSQHTQATIDLFLEHFPSYQDHLGIVIQSYLYRSQEDVSRLSQLPANIRLCKGAYRESRSIAFARKEDVDRNFLQLMEELFFPLPIRQLQPTTPGLLSMLVALPPGTASLPISSSFR